MTWKTYTVTADCYEDAPIEEIIEVKARNEEEAFMKASESLERKGYFHIEIHGCDEG